MRTLGQWNAYVGAGKTVGEVRSRLQEVPEEMRAQVKGHVDTLFALKRQPGKKRAPK